MARKLIIIAEAGIDTAVALAAAVLDPALEVVLVAGVAGVEPPETTNALLHALLQHIDPPRLPRFGAAPPGSSAITSSTPRRGLSGTSLRACGLHHCHPAEKLISESAREHGGELMVLTLGPLTTLALALERDRDLPRFLKSLIIVGGLAHGAGNAGPMAEEHFWADPQAARVVLQCPLPKTVVPLEIGQSLSFAPAELGRLTQGGGPCSRVLASLVPVAVHEMAREQGIEGLYLPDLFGVACVSIPQCMKSRPATVDVETRGELTRGACVIDQRRQRKGPNVDWVYECDTEAVRAYLFQVLREA